MNMTEEQVRVLETNPVPIFVNPKTQDEYVLVRKEMFERMRKLIKPIDRVWDDPALDVYEEYRKKP
jgi:hypothetical protein